MTREEAKRVLEFDLDHMHNDESKEALRIAIKELEQEPKIVNLGDNVVYGTDGNLYKITVSSGKELEQEPCEDVISRSDMLDAIGHGTTYTSEELQEIIKGMPPVNSQPKTGHWITTRTFMHDGEFYCDKCKCEAPNNEKWDYCPNCGCRMVEPQETETWNGYHGQITAPKGTFEKIYEDAESEDKE